MKIYIIYYFSFPLLCVMMNRLCMAVIWSLIDIDDHRSIYSSIGLIMKKQISLFSLFDQYRINSLDITIDIPENRLNHFQ